MTWNVPNTFSPGTKILSALVDQNFQYIADILNGSIISLNSPAFTGSPTAPTKAIDDESSNLATTEFVLNQASTQTPNNISIDIAHTGTSYRYSREDHVHANYVTTQDYNTANNTIASTQYTVTQVNTKVSEQGSDNFIFNPAFLLGTSPIANGYSSSSSAGVSVVNTLQTSVVNPYGNSQKQQASGLTAAKYAQIFLDTLHHINAFEQSVVTLSALSTCTTGCSTQILIQALDSSANELGLYVSTPITGNDTAQLNTVTSDPLPVGTTELNCFFRLFGTIAISDAYVLWDSLQIETGELKTAWRNNFNSKLDPANFTTLMEVGGADASDPPYQPGVTDVTFGTAGIYNEASGGDRFHNSTWIRTNGQRKSTATLTFVDATGANSQGWGLNTGAYANNATAQVLSIEADFGALVDGGVAYCLDLVYVGTYNTPTNYIQINSATTAAPMHGIQFVNSGHEPIQPTGALFKTSGTVTAASAFDLSTAVLTDWVLKTPSMSISGGGIITTPQIVTTYVGGGAATDSVLHVRSTFAAGTTDKIQFEVGNNGATVAGVITTNGNVTFGKTAPQTKFDILGGTLTKTDNTTYALSVSNGSGVTDITLGSDTSYGYIQTWTGRNLWLNSVGNSVLIGSVTSAISGAKLSVGGNIAHDGVISNIGAAPTIASATTIAPTAEITFVSGTTTINTITPPGSFASGGGRITLIPTGLWSLGVTGNIAIVSTAVVSKALILFYDSATNKWYPSY